MFIDYKCKYETYVKNGLFQAIKCNVDNEYCSFTGFCIEQGKVRHTSNALNCIKKDARKEQQGG